LLASREQMLEIFDKHVAAARAAIANTSNADFDKPWSLLQGGKVLFTMPRYPVTRIFLLNHMIHHRAFLLSYLMQNGVPIPGMYGPSGDESGN